MNINPKEVIERNIISNISSEEDQVQPNGIDLTIKKDVKIKNGEHLNLDFNEKFNMKDCFGIVNIRSSFSRKGIFSSSGIYDTSFVGIGGLTLYNMSGKTFTLEKGSRIAQMVCFEANSAKDYDGHYNESGIESQYSEKDYSRMKTMRIKNE